MQEQQPEPAQAEPPPPQPMQTQPPVALAGFGSQTNTLAIVSLISGIVSWFAVPVVGGVVAVVTGHMAKSQIRRTGEQGDTFATAGLVLGYLHMAVVVLLVLFLGLFLFGAFAVMRTTSGG